MVVIVGVNLSATATSSANSVGDGNFVGDEPPDVPVPPDLHDAVAVKVDDPDHDDVDGQKI